MALDAVVNETILLFKNSRNFRTGITIRCEVAPHLAVTGDPQRFRQVFWNLLINAAQAIGDGGSIGISAAPGTGDQSDEVIIRVSDTGTGIANEHLENIFDPFFTTKTDGTGLGLAIVYRIIEDLGGSIDVKSEPGKGTIFTIRLPFEEATAGAASHAGLPFPGR